jgi:NTE family protein
MKRALVLSGGGAKGSFQLGALEFLMEKRSMRFDIVAGVSVGALNGTMIAMDRLDRLQHIWSTIDRRQVMTGSLDWRAGIRMLFGAKSIYSNKPLWELIQREVDPAQIKIPLLIGVVCLRTGEYLDIKPTHSSFRQMVLASTTIPIVWNPVQVSSVLRDMVDGGVRNVCPLGSVIDHDPDEIVIINCSKPNAKPPVKEFGNALDIGQRTIDILTDEIFAGDLSEFLRINDLVRQAAYKNVELIKPDGRVYKYFKSITIEPAEPLGETLDFSRKTLERRRQHGFEMAAKVCGGIESRQEITGPPPKVGDEAGAS